MSNEPEKNRIAGPRFLKSNQDRGASRYSDLAAISGPLALALPPALFSKQQIMVADLGRLGHVVLEQFLGRLM